MRFPPRRYIMLLLVLFFYKISLPQVTVASLDHFSKQTVLPVQHYMDHIRSFYAQLGFKTAWTGTDSSNYLQLKNLIGQSTNFGLDISTYQPAAVDSLYRRSRQQTDLNEIVAADLSITFAAIHFFSDLGYGNQRPVLGYDGLSYQPACLDIATLLAEAIKRRELGWLIVKLEAGLPELRYLRQKITWLETVMASPGFKEVTITSNKANLANKPLLQKLYQLGLIDSVEKDLTQKKIEDATVEAQRQFVLLSDGVLRSTSLAQLNVPLSQRAKQLQVAINYYRWLNCFASQQTVVVVNIPSAYMKVYRQDLVLLEMKMVLGKRSTPTPTLASKITEVILYPYWHVPHSIATKEMLPQIRKNPGILNAGNFQVLGKDGKIMDPYKINWQTLSPSHFPFIIRQSTGCDNALGLLKLNFYSPYGVYLHDTPHKSAFLLNRRYFSHGCLRMEDPTALGHLVLKHNALAIDTLEQKGCLLNQSPITVAADEKLPVIVWYNPAGIDSSGRVLYFEDVYKKFRWMNNK